MLLAGRQTLMGLELQVVDQTFPSQVELELEHQTKTEQQLESLRRTEK
jgi:hypothetical protein